MENKNNLLCPCCNTKLVYTHSDRYQDLGEHVSQPNREPSIKPAFQCPNVDCIAHQSEVAWIEDGECYTGKRPEGISYSLLNNSLEARFGNPFAVNSWNWHYQLGKDAIKRRTKDYRFGKYRVVVSPKEKGYKYPTEVQYQPRKIGWKFEWWKKGTDEGCWINLIPTHRMVLYYLREFNVAYKNLMNTDKPKVRDLKECLKYIDCIFYNSKDDRSFAKISAFLIKTIYPYKVYKVRTLIMPSHE